MRMVVTGFLSLLWIAVGYFALLWLAKRFFSGRYRAQTAAAAVVIAFTVGINWSHPDTTGPDIVASAANSTPAPVAPALLSSGFDVGGSCSTTHLATIAGKGNLDTANVQSGSTVQTLAPGAALKAPDVLIVRGWAANAALKGPAAAVCVFVDEKVLSGIKIMYGGSRPDVAAAYQNDALTLSGFEINVPATRIASARHQIRVAAVESDGSAALISGTLELAGPPGHS